VFIAQRAARLQPSATLAVAGKAKAMKREGKPVISFGSGEPDFNSPASALQAASEAMAKGYTHYTPESGIPELKEAICRYYRDHFGISFAVPEVLVGAGAKPLIYEALGCLLDPGDETLVFTPAWVSYVEQIRLFDGNPVLVDTSDTGFIPNIERVRAAITPKTRCMIVNTPSNPTGAVYDERTLLELAELSIAHDITIIYDEIYERLVYAGAVHHQILNVCPAAREHTITLNGVSKAFAMTGWRIGYALGPAGVISKMSSFQGHLTSNPCSVAQYASLGAINGAEEDVVRMHASFSKRRDLILGLLEKMPHIRFVEPKGAFYVWIDIEKTIGMHHDDRKITNDTSFCETLLESKYVAAVPGSGFMTPGNIRVSYANAEDEIVEGMRRLNEFLVELR
jgi:aspartate aminotransferase